MAPYSLYTSLKASGLRGTGLLINLSVAYSPLILAALPSWPSVVIVHSGEDSPGPSIGSDINIGQAIVNPSRLKGAVGILAASPNKRPLPFKNSMVELKTSKERSREARPSNLYVLGIPGKKFMFCSGRCLHSRPHLV